MESIANGPQSTLLALMIMPILAATLLGGFLVFSVSRRRKKSKMKHGFRFDSGEAEKSPTSDELEINTNILSLDASSAPPPSTQEAVSNDESGLDLGLLGKATSEERIMDDKLEPPNLEPVDLAARLASARPDPAQSVPAPEPVELLRLLREPQTGQLLVEIAGERYTKLSEITDKKIGQFVLQLTAHLLAFTNGRIVTDAGMKSVYQPRVGEIPMPIAAPAPELHAPSPHVDRALDAPPEVEVDASEPASITSKPSADAEAALEASLHSPPSRTEPTRKKSGLFGRVAQPAPPSSSLPTLNLAEEINDIVQARLRYSPLAETNQIEIKDDLSGGIRIRVNDKYFGSPDDISDPEIKALIQASIKEWERS